MAIHFLQSKAAKSLSLAQVFRMTEGEAETALVIEENGRDAFYILNGDWHEKYLACKSLEECKALFQANLEHKSSWSEDME